MTVSFVCGLQRPPGGGSCGTRLCIHAKANIDLSCCPRGQSHRVALCPRSVGLDERSAGIQAEAKATGVVVMIVFVGVYASLRIIVPLLVLFVDCFFACTDASDSW